MVAGGVMANIAVQRIKREFKEVVKSEEVILHSIFFFTIDILLLNH